MDDNSYLEILQAYNNKKNKIYDVSLAKWDVFKLFHNLDITHPSKVVSHDEFAAALERYITIYSKDLIEFIINYLQEKNNP